MSAACGGYRRFIKCPLLLLLLLLDRCLFVCLEGIKTPNHWLTLKCTRNEAIQLLSCIAIYFKLHKFLFGYHIMLSLLTKYWLRMFMYLDHVFIWDINKPPNCKQPDSLYLQVFPCVMWPSGWGKTNTIIEDRTWIFYALSMLTFSVTKLATDCVRDYMVTPFWSVQAKGVTFNWKVNMVV